MTSPWVRLLQFFFFSILLCMLSHTLLHTSIAIYWFLDEILKNVLRESFNKLYFVNKQGDLFQILYFMKRQLILVPHSVLFARGSSVDFSQIVCVCLKLRAEDFCHQNGWKGFKLNFRLRLVPYIWLLLQETLK